MLIKLINYIFLKEYTLLMIINLKKKNFINNKTKTNKKQNILNYLKNNTKVVHEQTLNSTNEFFRN